jgi:hypothetical protein
LILKSKYNSIFIIGESFPIDLQILLKWELSSITPYIVRQIIQNSGLKLVRSECRLGNNLNNPSFTNNQYNQNDI